MTGKGIAVICWHDAIGTGQVALQEDVLIPSKIDGVIPGQVTGIASNDRPDCAMEPAGGSLGKHDVLQKRELGGSG